MQKLIPHRQIQRSTVKKSPLIPEARRNRFFIQLCIDIYLQLILAYGIVSKKRNFGLAPMQFLIGLQGPTSI